MSARFRGETPRIIAILNANSSVICGVGRATTRSFGCGLAAAATDPLVPANTLVAAGLAAGESARGARRRRRRREVLLMARSSSIFLDRPNDVTIHVTEVTTTNVSVALDETARGSARGTVVPVAGLRAGH